MDSNFTKNTFSYRFFSLNSRWTILSLKQLIQKELLRAIELFYQQHWTVNICEEGANTPRQLIAVDLSKKIVLSDSPNSFSGLVYSCAVAFPLANMTGLSPRSIAHRLVALLPSGGDKKNDTVEIAVTTIESGRIEFQIGDRSMLVWLNYLVAAIAERSDRQLLHFCNESYEKKKLNRLFPLQYICIRCASLLSLGAREGLICLNDNPQDLKWLIKQPLVINWSNSQGDLCLVETEEKALLRQICLMLDYIAVDEKYSFKQWQQFTAKMSAVWLQFTARCSFCGEIKQKNRTLATARLGLIALSYWCLQTILASQFEFILPKDL